MDLEYSENNLPPFSYGISWIIIALTASCALSVIVVFVISRILRHCYVSANDEEYDIRIGYRETSHFDQSQQTISTISMD